MIRPWYLGELETVTRSEEGYEEPVPSAFDLALERGAEVQRSLLSMPLEDRLRAVDLLGRSWKRRLEEGELEGLKASLAASTGYSRRMIDLEFELVPRVLDGGEIRANLDGSLVGGAAAVDRFVELATGQGIRHLPAGPVMIVASGNSVIPTLIPTVISLVAGNFTVLKPSKANYEAVVAALDPLKEAHAIGEALLIAYMGHDSELLDHALRGSRLGAVNFWGGEPARTVLSGKVALNPHHPRFMVNGPLTGVAIVDEAYATREAARGLAMNMVLYDQQLCSSPTMGIFVGPMDKATEFCRWTCSELEAIGDGHRIEPTADVLFVLNSVRRVMMHKGSKVMASSDPHNPWTVAVSEGSPTLDKVMDSFPSFHLHARRRFLEMVVVEDASQVPALVEGVGARPSYAGVDKVQTVGLAGDMEDIVRSLLPLGVYRFVPLGDMYMRGTVEPYDGVSIASMFTQAVYRRTNSLEGA